VVRDSSAAVDPAVSRDGKRLVYASDQAGNLDIWLRDIDSPDAKQLTTNSAADTSPDFSPDSSEVVFRSERDGGGIYLVVAGGGPEHLLVPRGKSPKFSPDGKRIAYWTGQDHHFQGKVFVISAAGGEPIRAGADLAVAEWPVWSSDGKELLVYGSRVSSSVGGSMAGPTDLFLVPVNGGPSRETGWREAVSRAGIWPQGPFAWDGSLVRFSATSTPPDDFSAMTQGAQNLWRIRLPLGQGRATGEPERITFGAGFERASNNVLTAGDTIFSSAQYKISVFEMTLDASGTAHGTPRPVFSAPGSYVLPYLARDGSTLVALSDRSGHVDIWSKDFHTGEERAVTSTETIERAPLVSNDGTVLYGVREASRYPMYRTQISAGAPILVCNDCGSISDVSPDGEYVVFHAGEPWSVYGLDFRTGVKSLLVGHARRTYSSRLSPDGKWIAFHVDTGGDEMPRRVLVAPFSAGSRIPESQWIPISDTEESDFDPCWSADGKLLFFGSDRDGNRCIWARRWNAQTARFEGPIFAVAHLHSMSTHIPDALGVRLSASDGRIVFGAMDLSSTIYRTKGRK
jgi:Tol biopolymer transport system component